MKTHTADLYLRPAGNMKTSYNKIILLCLISTPSNQSTSILALLLCMVENRKITEIINRVSYVKLSYLYVSYNEFLASHHWIYA